MACAKTAGQKKMEKNKPNKSQEDRVLERLLKANSEWVCGQVFLREMYLSQYHRAIYNLEKKRGIKIEHSDFKDPFGFVSYRILQDKETLF